MTKGFFDDISLVLDEAVGKNFHNVSAWAVDWGAAPEDTSNFRERLTTVKKYLISAVCMFPNFAHRLWFFLPKGYREDHLKRCLLKLVGKGDVCFEVGANVGQYTTFLSYLAGRTGRVVAFEPLASNLAFLAQHVAARKIYDNICIEDVALSNEEGEADLYVPDDVGAMASLGVHQNAFWQYFKHVGAVKVRTDTLDHYVGQHHVDRLDLLKVDIEGAESLFLAGAGEAIRRFKPVIVMEILEPMNSSFNCDPRQTFEVLRQLGYVHQFQLTHEGSGLRRIDLPTPAMLNSILDDFVFSTRELAWADG